MVKKVGRNDPCPCGSGKKYKNCCERSGGAKLGRKFGPKLLQIITGLVCLFVLYAVTGFYLALDGGPKVKNFVLEYDENADPDAEHPFGELPEGLTVHRVSAEEAARRIAEQERRYTDSAPPGIKPVPGFDYDRVREDGTRRLTKEEIDSIFEAELENARRVREAAASDTTSP